MNRPRLWHRMRGFDRMDSRFGKQGSIQRFIEQRLKTEKQVRIFEFGFGEGKCLLDLRKLFPNSDVQLYGVNLKKEGGMFGKDSFRTNARLFNLPVPTSKLLPKPFFYDATDGLHFPPNYFDVIISQVAFPYVYDKAKLLEEFWRVLKSEGKAFVHIDGYNEAYPDFLKLNKETPRFIIYENGKLVMLSKYLKKCRKQGFVIAVSPKLKTPGRAVFMTKTTSRPLRLNLKLDGYATFNLTTLLKTDKYKPIGHPDNAWWGTRSVFRTK